MEKTMTSPWLTTDEAAQYMKRSKRTVEDLINDCKLPIYRIDRRPLLKTSDIDKFIESKKVKA